MYWRMLQRICLLGSIPSTYPCLWRSSAICNKLRYCSSVLEMYARGLGFAPLYLEQATQMADPTQRFKITCLFPILCMRILADIQKPFNSILGETYQLDQKRNGKGIGLQAKTRGNSETRWEARKKMRKASTEAFGIYTKTVLIEFGLRLIQSDSQPLIVGISQIKKHLISNVKYLSYIRSAK